VIRSVFGTVIFVRALINPHSLWGRLVFAHYSRYRLFLSQATVLEVLEVIRRPELTRKFRSLKGMNVARIIEILSQAELVELSDVPALSRDAGDDKFLATCVAANADYLVTEDQDLLVLGEHEGTKIVDAVTFAQILDRE
jgi:uncharacterized protein